MSHPFQVGDKIRRRQDDELPIGFNHERLDGILTVTSVEPPPDNAAGSEPVVYVEGSSAFWYAGRFELVERPDPPPTTEERLAAVAALGMAAVEIGDEMTTLSERHKDAMESALAHVESDPLRAKLFLLTALLDHERTMARTSGLYND